MESLVKQEDFEMADKTTLENFRKQWKRDIENQNTAKVSLETSTAGVDHQRHHVSNAPDHITSSHSQFKRTNSDIVQHESDNYKFHPAFRGSKGYTCNSTEENVKQKSSQEYYPFRIVGNLLDESTSSKQNNGETGHCEKERGKDYVTSKSQKIKRNKEDENCNDFKKRRLKDIFTFKDHVHKEAGGHFLDQFIADLDEINEIPFFETTLAREIAVKIFWYLDVQDLCRCAQVSKSWRSLAEDDFLWCIICHRYGYEESHRTIDRQNWKNIVQDHVEKKRRLDLNWRNRTGKVIQLEHLQGGYLCAVTSYMETVVAGYTNGQVKMWDLAEEDECLFSPSNTSLVIDEEVDEGTISNFVTHVALSSTLIAASYQQGNVDIWRQSDGTDPIHTFSIGRNYNSTTFIKDNTDLLLASHSELLAVISGQFIKMYKSNQDEVISLTDVVDVGKWIHSAKIYGDGVHSDPLVTIATENFVKLHKPGESADKMTEVHSHAVNWGSVTCMDVKSDTSQIAVGLDMPAMVRGGGLLTHEYQIKVYDINVNKLMSTLYGSTWLVSCINIADSPPGMLVTGSGDRKLRVYDLRVDNPVFTYSGHSQMVTNVQMDEWKVVSSGEDGFVCVWDQRMAAKLWDWHNRNNKNYIWKLGVNILKNLIIRGRLTCKCFMIGDGFSSPVRHCHFSESKLIVGNVPRGKFQVWDEFESYVPKRFRGSVNVYDFSTDQMTEGVPDVCLSTYDQPEAYDYNIRLAMPYDSF